MIRTMDRDNVSHVIVLTNLHGLCELAKTELFKRKTSRTTIIKTKDDHYFFETVAIHDWNCDPESNPKDAGNANNVREFMDVLKQQEDYLYVRRKFNSDMGGDELVEKLCSPNLDESFVKIESGTLIELVPILEEGHRLSSDELTALGI